MKNATGTEQMADPGQRRERSRMPQNNDEFLITRKELGGVIDGLLYATKHADEEKAAEFMESLREVRRALGRDVLGSSDTGGRARSGPRKRRRRRSAGAGGAGAGDSGLREGVEALVETYGRVVPVAKLKALL
jgi:hypothetical protein